VKSGIEVRHKYIYMFYKREGKVLLVLN